MNILLYMDGDQVRSNAWQKSLSEKLPGSNIRIWSAGDDQAADYALVWKPTPEVLMNRPNLKAIVNLAAGVDYLVNLLRSSPGLVPAHVPVVRMEDAGMAEQMVEFSRYQTIRFFRRMHEYEAQNRQGRWAKLTPHVRSEFTVGVMGLGVLGASVAKGLADIGFPVRGWSRSAKQVQGIDCYAGEAGFQDFVSGLRVLVNLLPLTPETENILNRELFDRMSAPAYLINIGRGQHLVEQDLLDAIQGGQIAGAALDVFRAEPLPPDHPFWIEPGICVTPHIAAVTLNDAGVQQVAHKLKALEAGDAVSGLVDLSRGY